MKKIYSFVIGVLLIISLSNCKREREHASTTAPTDVGNLPGEVDNQSITIKQKDTITLKIYYENTLSMHGYIKENSGFKDVIRELIVSSNSIKNPQFETQFNLITDDALHSRDFGSDPAKIADELTPKKINTPSGNSNFEDILKNVINEHQSTDLSILIADFIYSPDDTHDTPKALNKLKSLTEYAFNQLDLRDVDTQVVQFISDFDGTYYDMNNKPIKNLNGNRPYYIFVFGSHRMIKTFNDQILPELKQISPTENEILFTNQSFERLTGEILTSTITKGRIKSRGAYSFEMDRNKILQFPVVLDLSSLPLSNGYLLNVDNYSVSGSLEIIDIGEVEGNKIHFEENGVVPIGPSDISLKMTDGKFTHVLLLRSATPITDDFSISMPKKVADWVAVSSSMDDTDIDENQEELRKTFGFSYLLGGVADSYDYDSNNHYFQIEFKIEK